VTSARKAPNTSANGFAFRRPVGISVGELDDDE
jgi:hypothetical protein